MARSFAISGVYKRWAISHNLVDTTTIYRGDIIMAEDKTVDTDGYYGDEDVESEDIDLSFLDEDEDKK
jgi:hypothetical protein